ncbi:MAG: hypothetical protein JWP63_2237 [Candidatus Solibacter sp.]|nr:hypothetical protein [Candidatus Solibacter sp.]
MPGDNVPIYVEYNVLKQDLLGSKDTLFGDRYAYSGIDFPDIGPAIRMKHPGGVNLIVVAPGIACGWTPVTRNDGTLAVLIGLLRPAVTAGVSAAQKNGAGGKSNVSIIGVLRSALAPGGELHFVNDRDGRLVQAA